MKLRLLTPSLLTTLALLPLTARAANDTWDNNPGGNWENGLNWTDGTTPGLGDSATFNLAVVIPVGFAVAPAAIQSLAVSAGTVTFASSGGAKTLLVTAVGGTNDLNLTGASTSLFLGTAGNQVNLTVGDDLNLQAGATLEARFGSDIIANDLSSTGLNGTVRIAGAGSTLQLIGASGQLIGNTLAGSLLFQTGSTGNTTAGPLRIADTATATVSQVSVTGGAGVTHSGNIVLSNQNLAGQSGTLNVSGSSSVLTQTGATTITVGSAANGTGAINLATTANLGSLTTGTGLLTVNQTGTITIGGDGFLNGDLNANGDVLINGGQITRANSSFFDLAAGRTLTVQAGGDFTASGGYAPSAASNYLVTGAGSTIASTSGVLTLGRDSVWNVAAGGAVSGSLGLSIANVSGGGAGTLTVDGSGSSASGTGGTSSWGVGAAALATFSNGAQGSFGALNIASTSLSGTAATVNVLSGADLTTANILFANGGGSGTSGTLNINGSNSTLTQTGTSTMICGHPISGTVAINIGTANTGGTLNTGTGNIDILSTATVTIGNGANAGIFNANGNVNLGGGQLSLNSAASQFNLAAGKSLTIQTAGGFTDSTSFTMSPNTSITVFGAGSTFDVTGGFLAITGATEMDVIGGGAVSAGGFLRVAQSSSGVLLVDGAGSLAHSSAALPSPWGDQGIATVSFRNNAAGTFTGGLELVPNTTGGGVALLIESGADVSSGEFLMAASGGASSTATVTIEGAGSSLTIAPLHDLTIGHAFTGTAVLTVNDGGSLTTGASAFLGTTGTLNINGGTVDIQNLFPQGGTLNFTAGSLSYGGNLTVGTGGLLGTNLTLAPDRQLALTGTTTIDAARTLTLDGGSFSTGALVNNGSINFLRGTLGITGAGGFNIGTGALGANVTLRDGALLDVTNVTVVNAGATLRLDGGNIATDLIDILGTVRVDRGTVTPDVVFVRGGGRLFVTDTLSFAVNGSHSIFGDGRLTLENGGLVTGAGSLGSGGLVTGDGTIALLFGSSGEVRAEAGKTLYFTGGTTTHSGRCNLQGGTLFFSQPFTNAAAGQINGHGELYFPATPVPSGGAPAAGLNNSGQMNLSGGDSLIFGTVAVNGAGKVIASGGATATFFDVFRHSGSEVKASAASNLVFFGEVRGPGSFTGTGTIYMEGGYSPGASPASVTIAPQMVFTESNILTLEIGGLTAGTQHDKLTFTSAAATQIAWGGTLTVEFLAGYTPAAGHSFDVFDFDPARDTGSFTTLHLPTLPAGLTWDTTQLYTTGTISIVPAGMTFSEWAVTVLGDPAATPGGDHDSDGYDNATEFALGLFPPQPGTVFPEGGLHTYVEGERLRLLFTRPLDRTGVTLKIQASSDLAVWEDLAISVNSAPFTGSGFVSENRAHPLPEPGLVEVRDILNTSSTPRRQVRLLITIAP